MRLRNLPGVAGAACGGDGVLCRESGARSPGESASVGNSSNLLYAYIAVLRTWHVTRCSALERSRRKLNNRLIYVFVSLHVLLI